METKKLTNLSLFILAISAFCIGTTEFIAVGLLPEISKAFHISIEMSGLSVSGYAIGVAIGAPILTILTNKFKRKTLLFLLMLVFTLGNFIVGISENFYIFMIARILTSFSHGVFFSVAGVIASDLVSEKRKASAISIVFSGLTIATITGVPLGTYIGETFNWRISFILITVLGLISLISILAILPKDKNYKASSISMSQFKILKHKKSLLVYIATIFGYGGTFVMYTYVSSIIQNEMKFKLSDISLIILFYGISLAIGNFVGGKLANKNTLKSLRNMFLIQGILLILFAVFMPNKILGLAILLVLGVFAFMNVPGLQHYIIQISNKEFPSYSNLASALSISSFNVGIFLGALVGGLVVANLSLRLTPIFGAIFVLVALIAIIYLIALEKADLKKNN